MTTSDAQWEQMGDLSEGIAIPIIGARFMAGIDANGDRTSNFHIHFDDHTVTPMEVVGLVFVSLFEWMHDVLHDRESGDG